MWYLILYHVWDEDFACTKHPSSFDLSLKLRLSTYLDIIKLRFDYMFQKFCYLATGVVCVPMILLFVLFVNSYKQFWPQGSSGHEGLVLGHKESPWSKTVQFSISVHKDLLYLPIIHLTCYSVSDSVTIFTELPLNLTGSMPRIPF